MLNLIYRKWSILRDKTLILMLKLKQVVIQYKVWNEVMLGLTQMMGCNACKPLLIMQMNDVEKHLRPRPH